MAKAKQTVSLDDLIRQALLTIAQAETPPKLTGKGGGVFASASAAAKEAIARLKDGVQPLVVESGTGKTATVSLTPAGFERIATDIPPERLPAAASSLAKVLPAPRRVAFLQDLVRKAPQTIPGLAPLLEEAIAAEKAEAETRAREADREREAEAASLAALERWKAMLLERKRQRIAALQRELAAEGEAIEVPVLPALAIPPPVTHKPVVPSPHPRPEIAPLPFPDDEDDINFRRNVARRLVSAWVDAWDSNKPDAREFVESAIWNVSGFRPIGEPGQVLKFDGQYHDGVAGVFTGDPVRVARPGWVLDEAAGGEYVVLKARVTRA